MLGEKLYELWVGAMYDQGIEPVDFEELDVDWRAAWIAVAAQVEVKSSS